MQTEPARTLDEIAARITADAELADLARRLREGVGRLNWRMRAEANQATLGPALLAVLSRLYRAGTQTPTELAEAERLQPQSLTRILAALTIRGLIEREPDPEDGRRSRISINADGLAALREYSAERERWLAGALESTLSPTEQQLLRLAADLLIRVADA
ncbi:MarR family winged helix-turn-helix transcriptional regulator [Amycolatopsis sp. NPDC004747]